MFRGEEATDISFDDKVEGKDTKVGEKIEAYNTRCSQAVTHPGTDLALPCLTSVIGREPVYSWWYGCRRKLDAKLLYKLLIASVHTTSLQCQCKGYKEFSNSYATATNQSRCPGYMITFVCPPAWCGVFLMMSSFLSSISTWSSSFSSSPSSASFSLIEFDLIQIILL